MKKRNKLLALLSVVLLVLFVTACGNGSNDNNELNDTDDTPPEVEDNGDTTDEPPVGDGEQIVLRYANWNLGTEEENNLERQMIQAFMDAHPNILIELDESYAAAEGVSWNENLAIAASTGNLPDVFMVSDIGVALNGGWLLDITDMANANPEFTALPVNMQDAMRFGGNVYAIPLQQHMQGFFVNQTMFEDLNLDAPTYGFTIEEFEAAIRSITDLSVPRVGANTLVSMAEWYPGAVNEEMGFFTFDGERFHLDSPEMIEAIRLATEWNSNGFAFYGLEDEQREMFNGGWHGEIFWNGEIGLFFDGTWATNAIYENGDFEFDFIGLPGGRPIAILDILGIASTTEHAEAAYKFANWMGSGTEGFTRRMELAQAGDIVLAAQPITADQSVLDAFWDMVGVPGIAEAYSNMDRALIDWNKITPGWVESRFDAPTGVAVADYENASLAGFIWHAVRGAVNYADYATRINEIAQEMIDEIQATID